MVVPAALTRVKLTEPVGTPKVEEPVTVMGMDAVWPMGTCTGCVAGPVMVTDCLATVMVAVPLLAR